MKSTRQIRKAYKQGKRDGYDIGYLQGLYDGNPFNAMIKSLSNLAKAFSDAVKEHPELLQELNKHDEEEELE